MGVVTVVAPHTTPTAPAAIAAPFTSAEIAIVERIAADAKLAATTPNPSTTNTLIERFRRFVVGLLRRTGITVAAEAKKAAAAADRAGQLAAADDLLRSLEPFGPTNDRDVVVSAGVRLPELHDMILARATGMHAEVMRAASGMVGNPASAEIDRLALAQKMLNDFTSRGITAYVDRSGRRWSLTAYVEMSTRTALSQLATDSYLLAAATSGHDLVRVTVVPNCSPMCAPYQGGLLSIRGLSNESPIGPGLRVPTVAEARRNGFQHPNAILGDGQLLDTLGGVYNGVRARYEGPAVHLTTASGVRLSVSPNHPVLTRSGWKAAEAVEQGDYLYRTVGRKNVVVPHFGIPDEEDLHNVEAPVEEVFGALSQSGSCSRVPSAGNHLHNDGRFCKGEIDVVTTDYPLLFVGDTGVVENPSESNLIRPDVDSLRGTGVGALDLGLKTVGGSRSIAGALANVDTPTAEAAAQRGLADTENVCEVLAGLPRRVAADEVVKVERDWFQGFAYDFQTESAAYAIGGIVVHNCRHHMVVWRPGDPVPTPPAIDPADYENTQRLRALERALRAAKRQQAGALTPAAAQRATTRVRGLQARIRDHVDTTNAPRMRRRELVGAPR